MDLMRNLLCFILLRAVLPLSILPGLGAHAYFPDTRETITNINGVGIATVISREFYQDGGPIAGCSCDWSMLTFRTVASYTIGGVWLSKIVANNTCKYGVKAIPVRCPGWKQAHVLKSTLTVHENNGTCLFFPHKVVRGGFRNYFAAFGKWLQLESFPSQGTYPCYNCSCFGCCLKS